MFTHNNQSLNSCPSQVHEQESSRKHRELCDRWHECECSLRFLDASRGDIEMCRKFHVYEVYAVRLRTMCEKSNVSNADTYTIDLQLCQQSQAREVANVGHHSRPRKRHKPRVSIHCYCAVPSVSENVARMIRAIRCEPPLHWTTIEDATTWTTRLRCLARAVRRHCTMHPS